MGYTIRTNQYRYMRWHGPDGKVVAHEIYDHQSDPMENRNLANKPEYADLLKSLNGQLDAGWQAARP